MTLPIQLGELLFHEGLVTMEELAEAYDYRERQGGRLLDALLDLGFVQDGKVAAMLSRWYGLPAINLGGVRIDPAVTDLVPADFALENRVLPVARSGASLHVVMLDPTDQFTLHRLKFMVPCYVKLLVAPESQVREAIRWHYGERVSAVRPASVREVPAKPSSRSPAR